MTPVYKAGVIYYIIIMIALEELNAFNKRLELIVNNSDSLEERTMASCILGNLQNIAMQLSRIPPKDFEMLCQQQAELEEQSNKEDK